LYLKRYKNMSAGKYHYCFSSDFAFLFKAFFRVFTEDLLIQ